MLDEYVKKQDRVWKQVCNLLRGNHAVLSELMEIHTEPSTNMDDSTDDDTILLVVGLSGPKGYVSDPPPDVVFLSDTRVLLPLAWFFNDERDKAAATLELTESALEDLRVLLASDISVAQVQA